MILTLDIIQNVVMVLRTFGCRKLVHSPFRQICWYNRHEQHGSLYKVL